MANSNDSGFDAKVLAAESDPSFIEFRDEFSRGLMCQAASTIHAVCGELKERPFLKETLEDVASSIDGGLDTYTRGLAKVWVERDGQVSVDGLLRETTPVFRFNEDDLRIAEIVAERKRIDGVFDAFEALSKEERENRDRPEWKAFELVEADTVNLQHQVLLMIVRGSVNPVAAAKAVLGSERVEI